MTEIHDTSSEVKMSLVPNEELELILQALEMARRKCSDDQMRVQLNRGIGAIKRALDDEHENAEK